MSQYVWIDGLLTTKADAKISVYDHGILYGDGVFEGLRQYHGKVFECRKHLERLFNSAKAIRLTIPYTLDQLCGAIDETLTKNGLHDSYIRLVVTRGTGTLGISPLNCEHQCVYIITDKIQMYPPEMYENGMAIITASTIRNHPNSLSPKIKSLNYLNNVLAKWEAIDAGVPEAVMLNHLGYVCECTGDNIFIVKKGELLTPSEDSGVLVGVTRDVVMALAKDADIPARETTMTRYDLYVADECFLTGTGAEIIPVTSIDKRPIGDSRPGPITKKLIDAFRRKIKEG
jgi:branched-chain amino acid aminotransferase